MAWGDSGSLISMVSLCQRGCEELPNILMSLGSPLDEQLDVL